MSQSTPGAHDTAPLRYSIVVPCYQSGPWTQELVDRIERSTASAKGQRELILVDDASPDDSTWAAICREASAHDWVRGIGLQFNVGQFRALLAGLESASGDYVITLDDDLQTPPEEIPKLVFAAREHPEMDAIIGAYDQKQHPWFRNLGSRFVALLFRRLYHKPRQLQTTSFRIMKRSLVRAICAHRTAKPVMGALVIQCTRRIMNVPVQHHPRAHGRSGYSLRGLVGHTLDNVISSTTVPLRAITATGILAATGSFVLSSIYVLRWARGLILEPGFTTLVLLMTFFGGLLLMSIGVIGEYLMRVVREVSGSPRHVVREEVGRPPFEDSRPPDRRMPSAS